MENYGRTKDREKASQETQSSLRRRRRRRRRKEEEEEEEEENETKFGSHPLLEASQSAYGTERQVPFDQTPITPEAVPLITDTPTSESQDPTYLLRQTPRSRREMQSTRIQKPVTRSRARIMPQENVTESTVIPRLTSDHTNEFFG